MHKVIKDGKVAVLVSHGYGAGWSSWAHDTDCLFDPDIVQLVLDGASTETILQCAHEKWPDDYWGGVGGLTVHWIPEGTQFRIDEYDGAESIEYNSDVRWIIA